MSGFWTRAADGLRDASIFYSFDRSGFEAHRRSFAPDDLDVDLTGRTCLVTGANSGIGYEIAHGLASRGAEVHLLCRRADAGRAATEELVRLTGNRGLHLDVVDVSSLASIRAFALRWGARPVHALVHNAGVLVDERRLTDDGIEVTFATHVVGPFLLTALLRPGLEAAREARVVTVSSGGLYGVRLDVAELEQGGKGGRFDGVRAYALAKRAQVVLTELAAQRVSDGADGRAGGIRFDAMHPGWVDTPGVKDALPRFYRTMKGRLRSPAEGADTAVWLAACRRLPDADGHFWFDRGVRSAHLVPWTREQKEEREALWRACARLAGTTCP